MELNTEQIDGTFEFVLFGTNGRSFRVSEKEEMEEVHTLEPAHGFSVLSSRE
jgi:hypothetical protein